MVIEGTIGPKNIPETIVRLPGRKIHDPDGVIIDLLKEIAQKQKAIMEGAASETADTKAEKKVCKRFGAEVAKIIMETRVRLNMLIDSSGGQAIMGADWREIMDSVVAGGGETAAFVDGRAYSAAAGLTDTAQKLFATRDSNFGWHLIQMPWIEEIYGEWQKESGKSLEDLIKKKFRESVRVHFEKRVAPHQKKELKVLLNNAENDDTHAYDRRFMLDSGQMEHFGFITGTVPDSAELSKKYRRENRIAKADFDIEDPDCRFFTDKTIHAYIKEEVEKAWGELHSLTVKFSRGKLTIKCVLCTEDCSRRQKDALRKTIRDCVAGAIDFAESNCRINLEKYRRNHPKVSIAKKGVAR